MTTCDLRTRGREYLPFAGTLKQVCRVYIQTVPDSLSRYVWPPEPVHLEGAGGRGPDPE